MPKVYRYAPDCRPHLTPAQNRALWFILEHVARTRAFPDHKAIAKHLGWQNRSAVSSVLAALVGCGYLAKTGKNQWRILDDNDTDQDRVVASQKAACAIRAQLRRRGMQLSPTK